MNKYKVKTRDELRTIIKEGNIDLSTLDVSGINDMSELFLDIQYINGDISNWDLSKAKDRDFIFG